jgi:SAM-dependent methyltransferase
MNDRRAPALERVDVRSSRPSSWTEYEHWARYSWASSRVASFDVLDAACGTGYGSELLARTARVTGVDRDPSAIETARRRSSAAFVQAEIPPFPFDDRSFDLVVSFETIEHIDADAEFVREAARVLRPPGILLISTPNKDVSSTSRAPPNPHHVREYSRAEFESVLRTNGFEIIELFGQRREPRTAVGRRLRNSLLHLGPLASRDSGLHRLLFSRLLDMDVRPLSHDVRPGFWIASCERVGPAG